MYSGKPTGVQQIGGWVVTTSATAITALAYPIPAIGVWMCVFQATPNGFNTNGTQILNYGLSVNPTSMDSSWPYQNAYGFATQVQYTRIFTVTNLTTTIYPIAFVDISNGSQGLLNYTFTLQFGTASVERLASHGMVISTPQNRHKVRRDPLSCNFKLQGFRFVVNCRDAYRPQVREKIERYGNKMSGSSQKLSCLL